MIYMVSVLSAVLTDLVNYLYAGYGNVAKAVIFSIAFYLLSRWCRHYSKDIIAKMIFGLGRVFIAVIPMTALITVINMIFK